jgi:hypothetical protein
MNASHLKLVDPAVKWKVRRTGKPYGGKLRSARVSSRSILPTTNLVLGLPLPLRGAASIFSTFTAAAPRRYGPAD